MDPTSFSSRTLGYFARVAPDYFTHTGLGTLFLTHGIHESEIDAKASKQKRILSALQSLNERGDTEASLAIRGMIEDLVPRLSESDLGGDGHDPQAAAFLSALQADGWSIQGGKLAWTGEVRTTPTPEEISIPGHSRLRSDSRTSRRIFIVHGRDKHLKLQVENFVRKLQYEPCVLGQQPNQGRTVMEKLIHEAQDAAFAIVLLTGDDVGSLAGEPEARRARQNVIFEFGFLVGHLGRERVAALAEEDLDLPSNLGGVARISVKETGGWQLRLIRELRAAGLAVDTESI